MPPVGAEALQSSPQCSFKDISAAQLTFHLGVFFFPPLLSWSFKTNKVSRTWQRDNHHLIPFPRVSRLFGDSAAAGGTFTEREEGASHRDNSSQNRAPEHLGGKTCLWFPLKCHGYGECSARARALEQKQPPAPPLLWHSRSHSMSHCPRCSHIVKCG